VRSRRAQGPHEDRARGAEDPGAVPHEGGAGAARQSVLGEGAHRCGCSGSEIVEGHGHYPRVEQPKRRNAIMRVIPDRIAAKLNRRPRKRLGYRTPEECYVP
jgi:hypothetical protein